MPFLRWPALQILICLVLYGALVWWGGAFVATITSPGLAAVLAVPIINLIRDLRLVSHASAWKNVQGQHYAYHGQAVLVVEDDDHCRWIRMADVRKIVGTTATDRQMAHTYQEAWTLMGRPSAPYIREDALVSHLGNENKPAALRMAHWVRREIAYPGERIRKRLGIYMQPFQSKDG